MLEATFYDMDLAAAGGNDDIWEEAFANPVGDPGYTLSQWTEMGQLIPDSMSK